MGGQGKRGRKMAGGSEMGMKSETASCMEEKEFIIEEWRAAILFLRMSPSTQSRSTGKERDREQNRPIQAEFGTEYPRVWECR